MALNDSAARTPALAVPILFILCILYAVAVPPFPPDQRHLLIQGEGESDVVHRRGRAPLAAGGGASLLAHHRTTTAQAGTGASLSND